MKENICVYCGTETNEEFCNICNEFDGIVNAEEYWKEQEDNEV